MSEPPSARPAGSSDHGACLPGRMTRRDLVKLVSTGTAGLLLADWPAMAGPFVDADFQKLIPADKKLHADWVASLTERGVPETFEGRDLRYIGMPVGGLFCGTVYLGGDGRLWLWDIFNRNQLGVVQRSVPFNGASLGAIEGATYVEPLAAADHRVLEQGFTLAVKTPEGTVVRPLDAHGFRRVTFTGQYPIGRVEYSDPSVPVSVTLEAFSPFIPLNVEESSLPATVLSFRLENASDAVVEIELTGLLENAACRAPAYWSGLRRNELLADAHATILRCSVQPEPLAGQVRPDVIFEEWSEDTYARWKAEGTAFGSGPLGKQTLPDYQGDVGGDSARVVNSHASAPGKDVHEKDRAKGTLTSAPFTIARRFINFWIGGGAHAGRTCLNLLVDGRAVRTATGRNDNRMSAAFFDVGLWEGRTAVLQIVDDEPGAWGNVGVGRITFSDLPASAVEPGQQRDFGTMALALVGAPAEITSGPASVPLDQRLTGALGRRMKLVAGEPAEIVFVIAWHFPNVGILPQGRRHYAARFEDAAQVAQYVCQHYERLAGQTRLWRDTWNDSTLPHWFLNRTFANTSILATTTCHRFSDGRFWAWEGIGCCHGTCTHVWQYAQALARVFPEVERDQRERVDFGLALADDGTIRFRAEHGATFAADGQAGRVLGVYREHQMSADDAFLKRLWPRVKRALDRLMRADPGRGGLLRGPLHNTLDADWFGYVPWLCGLYHAALRAGEEMAREVGDEPFARACRAILDVAADRLDAACWNRDYGYYVHRGDDKHPSEVGSYDGCHIDQVFGQAWARQVGLGDVMTPAHVRRALQAVWTYNFTPDVGPWRREKRAGRWYALAGDGGIIMVTFPFKADRTFAGGGAWSAMYFNECMSGFEHQVAAHMVWEGMLLEGLAATRTIHDRYHPRLRNPYNEVECSDHYARAMASYGTYLAACGFECHGPRGHLGFAPRVAPERFRAAFTCAGGWGTFAQSRAGDRQEASILLRWGGARLASLTLAVPADRKVAALNVQQDGKPLEARYTQEGERVLIRLAPETILKAGQRLDVSLGLT